MSPFKRKGIYVSPYVFPTLLEPEAALLGASQNILLKVEVDDLVNINADSSSGELFDVEF